MQTNHDVREGSLFISMTEEEASLFYDAIEFLRDNCKAEVHQEYRDALEDIMGALNLE